MTEDIQKWLSAQHFWIQEAAYRILTKNKLTSEDIADLLTHLKEPPENPSEPRIYPNIGGANTNNQKLQLISIGNIKGIDALNPRSPLIFGSNGNLSVVYGDNGAGKSGYTRILKKACGKSYADDLKSNVYKDTPAQQQCDFKYDANGNQQTITWIANSAPVEALKSIDIFDAQHGRIYVESDTEVTYSPAELVLFEKLVDACKQVEGVLANEQNKLVSSLPVTPTNMVDTKAIKIFSDLANKKSADDLRYITTWSDEDESKLEELRKRFLTTDPVTQAKKKRSIKAQIEKLFEAISFAYDAVKPEACEAIKGLLLKAQTKRSVATEGSKVLASKASLEGVGSDTWKNMWEAAREYSETKVYTDKAYPYTGEEARCVLCHQTLSETAKDRVSSFESYIKGKLETEAKAAEKLLHDTLSKLPDRPNEGELDTSIQASELSAELAQKLKNGWQEIDKKLQLLRSKGLPETIDPISSNPQEVMADLTQLAQAMEAAALQIENDAQGANRTALVREGLELAARKWTFEQSDAISVEKERLKKIERYKQWKKHTSTNGLSRKAGAVSKELLTDTYTDRFNDELKKLGASHIQVELKKASASYGRVKHAIYLQGLSKRGKEASKILSEGENRVVALAAFLADVTYTSPNAPFIFDDPISSLDQRFEEKTIDRLIELSNTRQVIVFTHRLSFLGIMSDKAGGTLEAAHIRREPWGTGEVGEIPIYGKRPDKALNNLIGNRLVQAEKTYTSDGSEAYYPLAKAICSDFRVLIERIVETVFLADVIQRHRRAVKTMGKINNLLKINAADCELVDELMTKYSCFEHSQSSEAPVEVPAPDELRQDIQHVIDWHTEFSKRALP